MSHCAFPEACLKLTLDREKSYVARPRPPTSIVNPSRSMVATQFRVATPAFADYPENV